jgi:hypothetical protein
MMQNDKAADGAGGGSTLKVEEEEDLEEGTNVPVFERSVRCDCHLERLGGLS